MMAYREVVAPPSYPCVGATRPSGVGRVRGDVGGGGRSGPSRLPPQLLQRGWRPSPPPRVWGEEEFLPLASHRAVLALGRSDSRQRVIVPPCPVSQRPSPGHELGNVCQGWRGSTRGGVPPEPVAPASPAPPRALGGDGVEEVAYAEAVQHRLLRAGQVGLPQGAGDKNPVQRRPFAVHHHRPLPQSRGGKPPAATDPAAAAAFADAAAAATATLLAGRVCSVAVLSNTPVTRCRVAAAAAASIPRVRATSLSLSVSPAVPLPPTPPPLGVGQIPFAGWLSASVHLLCCCNAAATLGRSGTTWTVLPETVGNHDTARQH